MILSLSVVSNDKSRLIANLNVNFEVDSEFKVNFEVDYEFECQRESKFLRIFEEFVDLHDFLISSLMLMEIKFDLDV